MDDEQFFARLRARDPQAQQEMIRVYTPRIFVYFRNRIKGEDHYEDLVQDVFGAFFNGLDQGKLAGPAWIAPFLFGIAKRVLYNYYYRQKKNSTSSATSAPSATCAPASPSWSAWRRKRCAGC